MKSNKQNKIIKELSKEELEKRLTIKARRGMYFACKLILIELILRNENN